MMIIYDDIVAGADDSGAAAPVYAFFAKHTIEGLFFFRTNVQPIQGNLVSKLLMLMMMMLFLFFFFSLFVVLAAVDFP